MPDNETRVDDPRKDGEGNVVDPPVIHAFEERIRHAAATADRDLMEAIHGEYHKERADRVEATPVEDGSEEK